MNSVSIQQVRFEFGKVKAALERGEELLLTFRNKPLAKLSPISSKSAISEEDPALRFGDGADELPILSNSDIDSAVYG
jgi:antitoxin (DNA-binding transcriptional repressor) of toxin-antitoxin stability system